MSRVVGIDLRDRHVRAVLLRTSYKKLELELLSEESVDDHASFADAVRVAVERLGGLEGHRVDSVVTVLDGSKTFVHHIQLPPSAEKRLEELLPFELEAQLPVEIDDVVYGFEILPRKRGSSEPLVVLTVSARQSHVEAHIGEIRTALTREPERVGASAIELGQLAAVSATLRADEPIVLVDVGLKVTDLCLVQGGVVRSGRSLSAGIGFFPARAEAFAAQLRQTLSSFSTVAGVPVARVVLLGDAGSLPGIEHFLQQKLGVEVGFLSVEGLEGGSATERSRLPEFGRAIAAGLHGAKGKGFDLRRGALAFQRGYGFLKDKAPLLVGMAAAVLVSFFFATWSESRALDREEEMLRTSLEQVTEATFQKVASDPEEALMLLEQARKTRPEDPMPYLDGFGAMVALSETLPDDIKHDVEQFDFDKGKLNMRGLVDSTDQAQKVAKALDEHRCFETVTLGKISQVVNSERVRYLLEAEVRCPEDPQPEKKKKPEEAP